MAIPGLTSEQVQRLLSLIEVPKSGRDRLSRKNWKIDSGASCHMTGNSSTLQGVEKILPIPIGLPGGTNTMASHQGTVSLGEKLKLKDVLYVPSLNCDLISVARLRNDLRCLVIFSDDASVV